jgi:hypothetical protein
VEAPPTESSEYNLDSSEYRAHNIHQVCAYTNAMQDSAFHLYSAEGIVSWDAFRVFPSHLLDRGCIDARVDDVERVGVF